jgi:hypothetical protein
MYISLLVEYADRGCLLDVVSSESCPSPGACQWDWGIQNPQLNTHPHPSFRQMP